MSEKSIYSKQWIIRKGIPIVRSYNGNLTLRSLHYRLVAEGMTNDERHYKQVVSAMIDARWDEDIHFTDFLDHERETHGNTAYEETTVMQAYEKAKGAIQFWGKYYAKNRWENQPIYPEVFIEKKALQGVFERPCKNWNVALNPCKGYPSLTFLYAAKERFEAAKNEGKEPVILYFGDYDCSGEDIPRSIQDTLERMGIDVTLKRIALNKEQVLAWKLPPAPTKKSDSRSKAWKGLGQVELDAVEPNKIVTLCERAISEVFDKSLYKELLQQEAKEKTAFNARLKKNFKKLLD